jgi:hypothetical protein
MRWKLSGRRGHLGDRHPTSPGDSVQAQSRTSRPGGRLEFYERILAISTKTPWWSWRESNPRPSRGSRPRYDHSRAVAHRLPPRRVGWASRPAAGSFPGVSVLSRRQRSLPAVLRRFCCRAATDRPRVPLLVAVCLGHLIGSGGESEVVVGLCVGAPFKESEQLRSHVRVPSFTSKPISPVSGPPSPGLLRGRRVSRCSRRTGD